MRRLHLIACSVAADAPPQPLNVIVIDLAIAVAMIRIAKLVVKHCGPAARAT